MIEKKMSFTNYLLLDNKNVPLERTFVQDLISKNNAKKEKQIVVYDEKRGCNYAIIIDDLQLEKECFFMFGKFGKDDKWSEKVIDRKTRKTEINKKQEHEIEPTERWYFFYNLSDKERMAYIPHGSKGIFLRIVNYLGMDCTLQELQIDIDEFIKVVDRLKKVRFVGSKNIFDGESPIYSGVTKYLGLGQGDVDQFLIELDIHVAGETKIRRLLNELIKKKEAFMYNNLTIYGEGSDGYDSVFRQDAFNKKMEIKIKADENESIEAESILQAIKQKVGI